MNRKSHRAEQWLMLSAFGFVCALVVVAGLMGPLPAASADLPPRPTAITPTITPSPRPTAITPTSSPSPQPTAITPTSTPPPRPTSRPQEPAGAWIELRIHQPGSDLPASWQQLWTAVQWQDVEGRWHDVEGWRGTLDEVMNAVGKKIWWVAQKDLGTGAFRWVVHRGQGGEYLAESELFTLPETAGMTVEVEVLLAP